MAKTRYNTVLDANITIEISLREVRSLLEGLEYQMQNKEEIYRWSDEYDLYNDLVDCYKNALTSLERDAKYYHEHTFTKTASDVISSRNKTTEEGEAA